MTKPDSHLPSWGDLRAGFTAGSLKKWKFNRRRQARLLLSSADDVTDQLIATRAPAHRQTHWQTGLEDDTNPLSWRNQA